MSDYKSLYSNTEHGGHQKSILGNAHEAYTPTVASVAVAHAEVRIAEVRGVYGIDTDA